MVFPLENKYRQFSVSAVGAFVSATAFAQAPAMVPIATPAAAPTSVPNLQKAAAFSAFDGYKPYTEEQVGNWKAVNDTVGNIGGWREYAKQAQPSSTPAASAPAGKAVEPAPKSGIPSSPSTQSNIKAKP